MRGCGPSPDLGPRALSLHLRGQMASKRRCVRQKPNQFLDASPQPQGRLVMFRRVPCALPPVSRATLRLHMGPPVTRPLCSCVQPVQPLKPEKADDRETAHPPALRPPGVWGATALRRPTVRAAACVPLQPPWTGTPARRRPVPALPTQAGLPDRRGAASAPGNAGKPVAGSARLPPTPRVLRPPALPWGAARPSAGLPARPATAEPRGDV